VILPQRKRENSSSTLKRAVSGRTVVQRKGTDGEEKKTVDEDKANAEHEVQVNKQAKFHV
jgi:hypothetical protein